MHPRLQKQLVWKVCVQSKGLDEPGGLLMTQLQRFQPLTIQQLKQRDVLNTKYKIHSYQLYYCLQVIPDPKKYCVVSQSGNACNLTKSLIIRYIWHFEGVVYDPNPKYSKNEQFYSQFPELQNQSEELDRNQERGRYM